MSLHVQSNDAPATLAKSGLSTSIPDNLRSIEHRPVSE